MTSDDVIDRIKNYYALHEMPVRNMNFIKGPCAVRASDGLVHWTKIDETWEFYGILVCMAHYSIAAVTPLRTALQVFETADALTCFECVSNMRPT